MRIRMNFKIFVFIASIFTSTIALMIHSGCQGPTGPDGDDSFLQDSLAPEIEWLAPQSGEIEADTILLSAKATDDVEIWKMVFFIAGAERQGTLVDTSAGEYQFEWLAYLYPEGPYPLMARAWDKSRNMSTTPVILVEIAR